MAKFKACCFTGHRPEKMNFSLEQPNPKKYALEERLSAAISGMAAKGAKVFYCGCARGFDLVAADLVLKYKKTDPEVKLVCVMPFGEMKNNLKGYWRKLFESVLSGCDEKVVVSESYTPWCYDERNRYMVDNSDAVITYWDGGKGGTENTIRYAKRKHVPIINISKGYGELPDESDLAENYTAEQLPFCE